MRVAIFGASGMVGGGVLLECLDDPRVASVLVVGRTPTGVRHAKIEEVLHQDFFDYTALRSPSCRARRLLLLPRHDVGGQERGGVHAADVTS